MSDKRLDHCWTCSVYAEGRNDAGVMVSVIARRQKQHDASSDWCVSSAKGHGKPDVSNIEHVQSVAIPVEAYGQGSQDKLCVKVSDHGRQIGGNGMGMWLTGRGLDGTAQVNDLALHPPAMCRDVGLHIVHLDVHVRPATIVEHLNALQTPFQGKSQSAGMHPTILTIAECRHDAVCTEGLAACCMVGNTIQA